jgi:hypothetical protein
LIGCDGDYIRTAFRELAREEANADINGGLGCSWKDYNPV